jgi:transcriptional regulator of nitric oxide reductase
LRAGHVTEALAHGADRAAIRRQTGHRSDAMLDRYAGPLCP